MRWFVCLLIGFSLARWAHAQPLAQITDVVIVLEGPVQEWQGVNVGLYGPMTTTYQYKTRQGFVYDTLRMYLEKSIATALALKLLPTQVTTDPTLAVPGKPLRPIPGTQGGHPRSFRLGGLPDQEDVNTTFAANPQLEYAVQVYARAYRVLGRGAEQITNKQQQEFYEMDLRLRLYHRSGRLELERRADHVRWDGQKFSAKIMGRRTTDTSISGNELLQLVDQALTQVLKGAKRKS